MCDDEQDGNIVARAVHVMVTMHRRGRIVQ